MNINTDIMRLGEVSRTGLQYYTIRYVKQVIYVGICRLIITHYRFFVLGNYGDDSSKFNRIR